jgi:glycosyltransferase involved in cell wall biosynthesis
LLAPIRVGGGTSFKILEAMASGIPVLTTPLGNAIGAKENKEILIADSASEFSEKIIDLLNDRKLYEKIAVNARKLIEDKYDWRKIVAKLETVYKSAL